MIKAIIFDFGGVIGKDVITRYYEINLPRIDTHGKRKYHKKKYKIGLLSNRYGFWTPEVKKQVYFSLFDAAVFSNEVGMAKPDTRMYQLIAERLDVKTEECVLIDNLQVNIEGAERAGMKGIWYRSYKSLTSKYVSFRV